MQLEPPPCTHMDSRIHTWTHWGVFSARTDVFTFIPRYMHAHTDSHTLTPLTLCKHVGC